MLTRRLWFVPFLLTVLWFGLPLVLLARTGLDTPLVVVRAGSPEAMAWMLCSGGASALGLILLGWGVTIPVERRRQIGLAGGVLLLLVFCWLTYPALWLNASVVRQPAILVQAATALDLSWLVTAVVGSLLALILCGQQLRELQQRRREHQKLMLVVREQINQGILLYDRRLRLKWANTAGQQFLFSGDSLSQDVARLLRRAQEMERAVSQRVTLDETTRLNVEARPLADGYVRIIAAPVATDKDQNLFYERFIRRIVHDMRNPLAAIIAHASNMQTAPNADVGAWRSSAQTIEQEAQRLTRLVDSMLFDARLSYVPLALERLDLVDVIEEVFFQHDERAMREGKVIELEKQPAPALIEADRDLLVRAISNLVDNSLKYSKAGAVVKISTDLTPTDYVITVSDTGDGIPPEYLPDRIFDALVRARPKDSGSGLGLAIVRKIVELHGGSITAQSTVGSGTTMTICLPR